MQGSGTGIEKIGAERRLCEVVKQEDHHFFVHACASGEQEKPETKGKMRKIVTRVTSSALIIFNGTL